MPLCPHFTRRCRRNIGDVMRTSRLRWHGHDEGNGDADCVKACVRLVVERTAPVGKPKKVWQDTVSADMRLLKDDPRDVRGRVKWRAIGWRTANPTASGKLH